METKSLCADRLRPPMVVLAVLELNAKMALRCLENTNCLCTVETRPASAWRMWAGHTCLRLVGTGFSRRLSDPFPSSSANGSQPASFALAIAAASSSIRRQFGLVHAEG